MRLFVALVPPDEAVTHLDDFLEVRRASGSFRWASAEQFHVTLAFLADVETAIAGGGAFPNAARARVLWAGLDLDDHDRTQLDRLATGCRAAANRAGIPVDGQRFRPHVTVARIGYPSEVSDWVKLLDGYAGPRWPADRIQLVASYLGEGPRGRPRYETVEEFTLASR
jgi:2'-5' RNA ligase